MKHNVYEASEVRPKSKQKKIRKTFSLSRHVWDAVFSNVPEGSRSEYVEEAIIQRIHREGLI